MATPPAASAASTSTRPAAPPLPPGVLAEAQGSEGMISSGESLLSLGIREDSSTLVAARWRGRSDEPIDRRVPRLAGETYVFLQVYGSGIGEEEQSLYALLSATPMNLIRPQGIAAWPVLTEHLPAHARAIESPVAGSPASRRVTVLGYLGEAIDGSSYLDLPHLDAGAVRYRLSGPKARALYLMLPCCFRPPDGEDIGTDVAKKTTLRDLLGGGGWSGSDVRLSPVVIAVTGTATVAAVVHPRTSYYTGARKDVATDPRLPRGGVLYDLAVEDVPFTFKREAWTKLKRKLAIIAARAAAAIEGRDFSGTRKSLTEYLEVFESGFGPFAPRVAAHVEVANILAYVRAESTDTGARTTFAAGAACDRVAEGARISPDWSASDDAKALAAALDRCARRGYREAERRGGDDARVAAGRLLRLLQADAQVAGRPSARVTRIEGEMAAIERKYPGIQPVPVAPKR